MNGNWIKKTRMRVNDLRSDERSARKQLDTETAELASVVERLDDAEKARDVLQAVGQAVETLGCRFRVTRGGAWNDGPEDATLSARSRAGPATRSTLTGFRIARTLPR